MSSGRTPAVPGGERLFGKTALVAGGTRGIGRAICELFAAHGAVTVVTGRDEADRRHVAETIRADGGIGEYLALDAVQLDILKGVIADVAKRHGRLDVLVNNAGFALPRSLLESSVEDYDELFDLNVWSLFFAMEWAGNR